MCVCVCVCVYVCVCLLLLFCPQVLDGAGLDVDFFISSPSGEVLFSDYRKSDGVHT